MVKIIQLDNFADGHKKDLIKHGLITSRETKITVKKLVQRALSLDKIETLCDVLSNELLNKQGYIEQIEMPLARAKKAVDAIKGIAALKDAEKDVQDVEISLKRPKSQVVVISECLRELLSQMEAANLPLTEQAGAYLESAAHAIDEILALTKENGRWVNVEIQTMKAKIEEKRKGLMP